MRVLVTGGSGFIAGHILANIPNTYEVYTISRNEKLPVDFPANVKWIVPQSDRWEEWEKIVDEVKPDVLIHTSAIADIDLCEKNKEMAYQVNVELTKSLIRVCEKHAIRFIFCSSDTVFDGKKGMYTEKEIPIPVNYYGRTKVEAEKIVLNSNTSRVIARISLVMGFPVSITAGNSFMARMEQKISKGENIPMPEDEYRTPIDVITLAKALIELATLSSYDGIIHLAGNDRISRYDMAIAICNEMGWDTNHIVPSIIDAPDRAPRPKDVSLDNRKAKELLKIQFCGLRDGICKVKEDYLKRKQKVSNAESYSELAE